MPEVPPACRKEKKGRKEGGGGSAGISVHQYPQLAAKEITGGSKSALLFVVGEGKGRRKEEDDGSFSAIL